MKAKQIKEHIDRLSINDCNTEWRREIVWALWEIALQQARMAEMSSEHLKFQKEASSRNLEAIQTGREILSGLQVLAPTSEIPRTAESSGDGIPRDATGAPIMMESEEPGPEKG